MSAKQYKHSKHTNSVQQVFRSLSFLKNHSKMLGWWSDIHSQVHAHWLIFYFIVSQLELARNGRLHKKFVSKQNMMKAA